jgi:hypothetical protein
LDDQCPQTVPSENHFVQIDNTIVPDFNAQNFPAKSKPAPHKKVSPHSTSCNPLSRSHFPSSSPF